MDVLRCIMDVSMVFHECFKGLYGCFKRVSCVLQSYFKADLRGCKGCNNVSSSIILTWPF